MTLPFGVRTHADDNAEMVPGQVHSAPLNFRPRRILKRATMLSVVLFGLFYLNYVNGWITTANLDVTGGAPDFYKVQSGR